jgi:hypothetical protein
MNQTVTDALHDTRWLIEQHRDLLEAGKLKLPGKDNHFEYGGHSVALVSVPDERWSTKVSWIDVEIAELVWLLNRRYGLTTIESCQGDPGQGTYLAFKRRRHADGFLALAGDSLRGESRTCWGRDVWFGHLQLARVTRAVESATP